MDSEQEFFLENLTLLLKSGMPILEAFQSLGQEIHAKRLKKDLALAQSDIESGTILSVALESHGLLPRKYVSLMRIGEDTGQLTDELALIVQQMRKEKTLNSKVGEALIYPLFVLTITGVVSLVTILYTLPKLENIFSTFGGTLPLTTRIIIDASKFLAVWGIIAIPLFIAFCAASIFFLFFFSKTKFIGQYVLMSMPLSHTLIQQVELARFGYMMGTLMHAGISVPEAFDSLENSTTFIAYKDFYKNVRTEVVAGNSLYAGISMQKNYTRYMPPHIVGLIAAGERGGALTDTLLTISSTYEEKTEGITNSINALIEPVIIVVVGIIVAVVAFSIISPIYGTVAQIN